MIYAAAVVEIHQLLLWVKVDGAQGALPLARVADRLLAPCVGEPEEGWVGHQVEESVGVGFLGRQVALLSLLRFHVSHLLLQVCEEGIHYGYIILHSILN